METFLIRALQLILSLSILVFIHELGHFLFARMFKVRVEKFYLFFNPKGSIVRAKKINGRWRVKFFSKNVPPNERPKVDADGDIVTDSKGRTIFEPIPLDELDDNDWRKYPQNTEWGIGWVPLGGYCKIAGMVDESMDITQMAQEPQPWEYRSRPTWQRLPIITGGVIFNFILAIIIYIGMLFINGKEYFPVKNAAYGLEYSQLMQNNGFRNGDNILFIDNEPITDRADIVEKILIDSKQNITVLRGGETIQVVLPKDFNQQVLAANDTELFSVRQPFVIYDVAGGTPASKAGLESGDSIIGVNGKDLFVFQDIARELAANSNSTINLKYVRDGNVMETEMELGEDGKIGVSVTPFVAFFPVEHIKYGFFESIPAGIQFGWETLTSYVKQFKIIFTKEGSKQLGGFGAIGQLFPKKWDWNTFWFMTAFLSIILAFMNILPIPALDGGHVVFLLYEMITGRKPSDKFMEYAQTIGLLLLLFLVIYANGNDIIKLFK
ncbi:RIP metalloprotease RseP [Paludibacteraceae bacterium OttesenSCG-928-F17]|nr:RIP metalloprotease RseP [Paludibacteraceae bacterium OttesenSCG-928-F17]